MGLHKRSSVRLYTLVHKVSTRSKRNKGRTEEGHPKAPERQKNTPHALTIHMESKAKSSVKPGTKTEKKESAPPPKPNPAPAEPAPPTEEEKPVQDGNQEGAQEGNEAAGGSCETLENLKPFLIGGAIVALGAVLVGLVLLARKK
ncbi:hypothetical protein PGIGA_G00031250 [Pangasianodon gigas]|uniref:Uncharacterized protein n=1 Tax=Pangasianodon gigas TaxID=30993 RepID=A0ACC5WXP6_PANGG|nr:hypothetical protein [Pangasianodon gigas]